LGLGAVAGYWQNQQSEAAPRMALPPKGLAILTAVPFSDVFIEFPQSRNFIIGRTSRTGTLSLADLYPDTYKVQVQTPDGSKQAALDAVVENGKGTVLGGPPGKRLLDGSAEAKF
jgi:hypothetical protein